MCAETLPRAIRNIIFTSLFLDLLKYVVFV